jgi:hypothetical protein
VTDSKLVELRHHIDLRPAHDGDVLVDASVGSDHAAVVMWSTPEGREALRARTQKPDGASFPDPAPPLPASAHIVTMDATGVIASVKLSGLPVAHPHVQPLPGRRYLVVGARCRWRPEGPDRNAVIYDQNGAILRRATLGDGINHVLTTPSGMTWVGYFDEGIYGNYGWNGPGPAPIGGSGIVRFNNDLQPDWQFSPPESPSWVSDCYALNVTVWSTYYMDFPVVRIADSVVTSWPGTGKSPRALIVADTRCALIDGAERPRILVGDLDRGHFKRCLLSLPRGKRLPRGARFVARGPDLHVFTDSAWYRLVLDDVP